MGNDQQRPIPPPGGQPPSNGTLSSYSDPTLRNRKAADGSFTDVSTANNSAEGWDSRGQSLFSEDEMGRSQMDKEALDKILEHTSVSSILDQQEPQKKKKKKKKKKEIEYDEHEFILHELQKGDTIEGLAIRFNVTATEIKRANKIWRTEDIFARKNLLIPKVPDETLQAMEEKEANLKLANEEVLRQFMEQTGLPEQIAKPYVARAKYVLVDALQKFEMDVIRDKGRAEAGTLVATPVPDFSKEESSTSATQLSSARVISEHQPAKRVNAHLQRRMVRDEDDMYDL